MTAAEIKARQHVLFSGLKSYMIDRKITSVKSILCLEIGHFHVIVTSINDFLHVGLLLHSYLRSKLIISLFLNEDPVMKSRNADARDPLYRWFLTCGRQRRGCWETAWGVPEAAESLCRSPSADILGSCRPCRWLGPNSTGTCNHSCSRQIFIHRLNSSTSLSDICTLTEGNSSPVSYSCTEW